MNGVQWDQTRTTPPLFLSVKEEKKTQCVWKDSNAFQASMFKKPQKLRFEKQKKYFKG